MTGHQPLIAMRRQGYRPEAVHLIDGDVVGLNEWQNHANPYTGTVQAEVRIAADDVPEALDLRWVVGMPVHVHAWRSVSRARRIHEALIAAKPATVMTCVQLGDLYRPSVDELWIFNGATNERTEQCPKS